MTYLPYIICLLLLWTSAPYVSASERTPLDAANVTGWRNGTCSYSYIFCNSMATCEEGQLAEDIYFRCVCPEGVEGDGFVNSTGCVSGNTSCGQDSDCHQFGACHEVLYICECRKGYFGDGFRLCNDTNECLSNPCHVKAICQNSVGSFTCTCDFNNDYEGNGFNCTHRCDQDTDCPPDAMCNVKERVCVCMDGYEKVDDMCYDIDECQIPDKCENGTLCVNSLGSYSCECENGYQRKGSTCVALPRDCEELFSWGERRDAYFHIDPDFKGPANDFVVYCDFRYGYAVTLVRSDVEGRIKAEGEVTLNYGTDHVSLQALLTYSVFCFQSTLIECDSRFSYNADFMWIDAYNQTHTSWAGSYKEGMCGCGELGKCDSCYCNNAMGNNRDYGLFVDKTKLPVTYVRLGNSQGGKLTFGPLKCAHRHIDISSNCEPYRRYKKNQNGAYHIDTDGGGPNEPFLVYCDLWTYPHVAVTELQVHLPNIYLPTQGTVDVTYLQDMSNVLAVVDKHKFCIQRVEYVCQNSGITGGRVYVNVSSDSRQLPYFPGANGEADSCGCGATHSCHDPDVRCDCDIEDGTQRRDLGDIIDKNDLPVTAVTGGTAHNGNYFVISQLQCGIHQFGIPANCEKLRTEISEEPWPYTYFIDPDGPPVRGNTIGNVEPFLAQCLFNENPAYGITVIHHTSESWFEISGYFALFYLQVSFAQLIKLKERSTFCIQNVDINCTQFSLTYSGGAATWKSLTSTEYVVSDTLTSCTTGAGCGCDGGSGPKTDFGMLTDMASVPITSMDFSDVISQLTAIQQTVANISIGPLQCSELFPTCADLYQFVQSKENLGERLPETESVVAIDPDGAGNVQAFEVECKWPDDTVVTPTNPDGGVIWTDPEAKSKCFDITYTDQDGDVITPEQLIALRDMSKNCFQKLAVECLHARVNAMVNFTTCDGVTQVGWAGSLGQDSCQCGVTGHCAGGKDFKCHCDLEDGTWRKDGAVIIHKDQLPVCQVCLSLDGIPPDMKDTIPRRRLQFSVSALNCHAGEGRHVQSSCQTVRLKETWLRRETTELVYMNPINPIPVGCRLIKDPPVGHLEVIPQTQVFRNNTGSQTFTFQYYTVNMTILHELMMGNIYCAQKIYFFCLMDNEVEITLTGSDGWRDFDGSLHQHWDSVLEEEIQRSSVCEEFSELCERCGPPKSKVIYQKAFLPITSLHITLPDPTTIVIDSARCSDLHENCYEIMVDGAQNQLGARWYAIDPDGAGGVLPLKVKCLFRKGMDCSITTVLAENQYIKGFRRDGQRLKYTRTLKYYRTSAEQIQALANMSSFCWQNVGFDCIQSKLINKNNTLQSHYFLSGEPSASFGTADDTDFVGCACGVTGTCGNNNTCRCDARSREEMRDDGVVTDKSVLPVTHFHFAYQYPINALAVMKAGHVKCTNAICHLFPRNCHEALTKPYRYPVADTNYKRSGEFLIHPNPEVCDPFLVYCEMDLENNIGVTKVITKTAKNSVMRPGESSEVEYYGPTEEQLRCLVSESAYCIQPVSYLCYKVQFLGGGVFWKSLDGVRQDSWGGGEEGSCACGADHLCGGQDSRTQQQSRMCNCDANDERWRKDAGVLVRKDTLPLSFLDLSSLPFSNTSRVNFTIGDLLCSQLPIEYDECANGFHDCAEHANCTDKVDGYTCTCHKGWEGKTQNRTVHNDIPVSNGRECFDDDECSFNVCPTGISDCINTPGSFKCICHDGFRQTGPTSCEDIDECRRDWLNDCDKNAKCINQYGTYKCQCHRSFRGSGTEGDCFPVGNCVLFGDPHVISFDRRWVNYQGTPNCPLTAVTTACPGEQKGDRMGGFSIFYTPWKQEPQKHGMGEFTWVKSLEIHMSGHVVEMLQNRVLIVDGIAQPVGFAQDGLVIFKTREKLVMKSTRGVEVYWDGKEEAEVVVPVNYNDSLCGICGNFDGDSEDDWIVGPACNGTEVGLNKTTYENDTFVERTDNENEFGNSWMLPTNTCVPNCVPINPTPLCVMSVEEAQRQCRTLFNRATSVFKLCLRWMDREEIEVYEKSCVFDMCRVEDDVTAVICKYAEILAEECQLNTQVDVSDWRQSGLCDDGCENGRVRTTCDTISDDGDEGSAGSGQTVVRTCLQLRAPDMGFNYSTGCVDGCFCPPSMLEEGERCVPEEQCGCFHNNTYILLDQTLTDRNCNESVVCLEAGVVKHTNLTCPEHEHCTLEDNVVGCHCVPGYIRVGDTCHPDPCQEMTCPPRSECVEGQCQCLTGYVGDCEACEDINECASDLDNCIEDLHERCVNTNGSYHCACEAGFVRKNGVCTDEDECALGIDSCPAHSQCRNEEGNYACSCCVGYRFNVNTRQCVWEGQDTMYLNTSDTNLACCDCNTPECNKPGPVCGSDGETYSNIRALIVQSCLAGKKDVEPMYEGSCEFNCSQVQCLRPYATCEELPSGLASCGCPTCTTIDIQIINLVCASNNIFYRSKCEFEAAMCLENIVEIIIVTDPAPCNGPGGPGGGGSETEWSDCSTNCGLGTMKKTVTVGGKDYDVTAVCYANCPNKTCTDFSCGKMHDCVETSQGKQCMCPHCGGVATSPVCGIVGQEDTPETHRNPCELKRAACLQHHDFVLLEEEPCQREPTECAAMDGFERRTDQYGCRNPEWVNYRHCKGGCGQWPADCCYKHDSTFQSVPFVCPSGAVNFEPVEIVISCNCIPPEELEALLAEDEMP